MDNKILDNIILFPGTLEELNQAYKESDTKFVYAGVINPWSTIATNEDLGRDLSLKYSEVLYDNGFLGVVRYSENIVPRVTNYDFHKYLVTYMGIPIVKKEKHSLVTNIKNFYSKNFKKSLEEK